MFHGGCSRPEEWSKLGVCIFFSIPKEAVYADNLVICTAFSGRHLASLVERVNKVYKRRKHRMDPDARVEGRKDPNWRVLDMNNIILHVMTHTVRAQYDIEQLWAVGPKWDSLVTQQAGEQYRMDDVEQWLRDSNS